MKKSIKILVSLIMVVAIAAVIAVIALRNTDKAYDGDCGENIKWSYNENKQRLTVSGEGEMFDYYIPEDESGKDEDISKCAPWYNYRDNITEVVIEKGVIRIGDGAFGNMKNLDSVSFPETLISIGDRSFENCTRLSKIDLPENLYEIGSWTFSECNSLKDITLPKYLKYIGRAAFEETKLVNINLPDGLRNIGRNAFANCHALEGIAFPNSIVEFQRGILTGCENLKNVSLPNDVINIGREMFSDCSSLEEITIPDSVNEIGMFAFEGCTKLNKIKMSENIININQSAFTNTACYNDPSSWENGALYIDGSLIEAKNISGSYTVKDGTKHIASRAFSDCGELKTVTVPESVKSLGYLPFCECDGLTDIYFLGYDMYYDETIAADNESKIVFHCYRDSAMFNYAEENNLRCVEIEEN